MSIAKSSLDIVENTLSKPQKTLEFEMTKQKEPISFDVPLELPEQWMMGVRSLEVYNTVNNITEKNNKHGVNLKNEQLNSTNIVTELLSIVLIIQVNSMRQKRWLGLMNL